MKKLILPTLAALFLMTACSKKEQSTKSYESIQSSTTTTCKTCNEVSITSSRKLNSNDKILIDLLNHQEIKDMDLQFGELDLTTATVYNSNKFDNIAVSIKFKETSSPSRTETVQNDLIVYLKNEQPEIITIRQIQGFSSQSTSGNVKYFETNANELLSIDITNNKPTLAIKGATPGNTVAKEKWTECMKRAAVECSESISCTITCALMSVECAIGFGIGCAINAAQ